MRLADRYDKLRECLVETLQYLLARNLDPRRINPHEIKAKIETLLEQHPAGARLSLSADEKVVTQQEGYSYGETMGTYTYRVSFRTKEELDGWLKENGPQRGWKQGIPEAFPVDAVCESPAELAEVK